MPSNPRLLVAVLLLGAGCQNPAPQPTAQSLTVFPLLLAGQPNSDAAAVLGSLLERGGMPEVQVHDAAFAPPVGSSLAEAFGRHVQQQRVGSERALLVRIDGARPGGITSIDGVLVDGAGQVLWQERQAPGSAAFDRKAPKEPLDACILMAQRLQQPLGLLDPLRTGARPGKLGLAMQLAAGVPDAAEQQAMDKRLADARQLGSKLPLRVLPPRVGSEWPQPLASDLAQRLTALGFPRATAAATALPFSVRASHNQQAVLWSGARSLAQAVRSGPPGSDYLLAVDVLMANKEEVGGMHCYLLSPAGELVWVDYRNSHHADFRKLARQDAAACMELAADRVAAALR